MPRIDRTNRSVEAVLRTARGADLVVRLPSVNALPPSSCSHRGVVFTLSTDTDQGRPVYDEQVEAKLASAHDPTAANGWAHDERPAQSSPSYGPA
jgi:hypothetical protein